MLALQRLANWVKIHRSDENDTGRWINEDLVPLPPSRRVWGVWTFVSFWAINNVVPLNFQVGSVLIALGLSVWQAMIAVIVGKLIVVVIAVLNGWVGAEWHIGFAVLSRFVWGMYGSYFILAQRILLSCVWMACQGWTGGLCVSSLLSALSHSFHTLPNKLSDGSQVRVKELIGFGLFSLLTCCFLWVPPERMHRMMWVMNVVSFVTMSGITVWALVSARGVGSLFVQDARVKGTSETGWAIVQGITSVLGAIAVGLTNQPDYSRFATRIGAQIAGQLYSIPVVGTLIALFGCITASATQKMYGELIWNPPTLVEKWLEMQYSPGTRAGAFFASLGLIVAQIGINLADNAYSGGMDLAGIAPAWINIRRGAYMTLIISILIQPWRLLSSATTFLAVLSAYSVFLGPLVGIMITDYWLVRHRKLMLSSLFRPDNSSIYWFWHGVNPRAFAAWVCGFAPLLPGFIGHINPAIKVSRGLVEMYYLAFPLGFAISATLYYAFCRIWCPTGLGQIDKSDIFGTFTEAEARHLDISTDFRKLPS